MPTDLPALRTIVLLALFSLLPCALGQGWELTVCADPDNLPYSNAQEEGFENRIAEVLAAELGASLRYVWRAQRRDLAGDALRAGECDALIGVPDGQQEFNTTLSYYRSSYVFVRRNDAPFELSSLDDPVLEELRIGVQVPAGGGADANPPAQALANRGLISNLVSVPVEGAMQPAHIALTEAVADGEIDLAIAWGPAVGPVAARQRPQLEVTPVQPQFELPYLPLAFSIAIGVRRGDTHLADLLNGALVARWDEIHAILESHHVPLLPLPPPSRAGPD